MPLDVWLVQPPPAQPPAQRQLIEAWPGQPMVPLSEAIFDELRQAAQVQAERVPLLAKALRVYYGPQGHFEFSPQQAEGVANELRLLITKLPLSLAARQAAEELVALCQLAARRGLLVHGYPD